MKETITKFSPSLERDASYTKVSRINRLPAYLTIQMVRFHFKGNVQTNAKLLRDVKFSLMLDVYELCTKELQEKLAPMRLRYKNADDRLATTKAKIVEADQPSGSASKEESMVAENKPGASTSSKPQTETAQSSKAGKSAYSKFLANDQEEMKKYTFAEDPGSNNSGFYELRAVLTHKGRSSASGHYVAWIKREDQWYKCDDDYVEPIDSEEILKLSGGGDWHCAYVLLYGPRYLDESNVDDVSK
jgi:ubiquitin carboxyl-terminal hydrolase 14